jgi:predicted phage terminase large subunit-like protein
MEEAIGASVVRMWPDTFAEWASEGRWIAYPWVQYLGTRIRDAIDKGGARILVSAPPQHGKSQLISNWVPTWFLNQWPNKKVILGTYAQAYADTWGSRVKNNLMHNRRAFVPIKNDSKSKRLFITRAEGQMLSVGVDGPATGQGADLFIVDDPFKNYEEAMSPRIRERNMDWFRSVATTRLAPGGSIIVLHTRWHEADMIGELEAQGNWEYINLAAIAEKNDPMGRPEGEPLCPDRYDRAALDLMRREVGEMVWSALYQGKPVQVGGNIIRGEWIKRYKELPRMEEVAVFADLTYKEGEENDFAVVEAWGRAGANIYLIAQIRAQMGFADQLQALERMFGLYPDAFHKEIEEHANGAAVIETLKATFPGIEANRPKTEKAARLAAVAPLYHAGNVWYPDETIHPWVNLNLNEITKFQKAKNDDTVDCATMAVNYFGRMASSMRAMEALGRR